jgi:hypothetical protein
MVVPTLGSLAFDNEAGMHQETRPLKVTLLTLQVTHYKRGAHWPLNIANTRDIDIGFDNREPSKHDYRGIVSSF